jgi:hypothetical protein
LWGDWFGGKRFEGGRIVGFVPGGVVDDARSKIPERSLRTLSRSCFAYPYTIYDGGSLRYRWVRLIFLSLPQQ